jgi:TRAP-type C4-dicarboxylate transport system permease small subunit
MLRKFDMVFRKIEKFFSAISWIVALLVSALIVVDVSLRAVFDKPLPATWEISEVMMPLIVFLSFAYTLAIDAHVKVTLFRDRMPPKVQAAAEIFSYAISFVICAMITYESALYFWESFVINEEMLAAIRIPWWVGKAAMPLGFGLFAIRFLILLFYDLSGQEYTVEAPTDAEKFVT